uniref:SEC7 domain-containing protein n=1 Tax=Trichogramma kaykai TaxID=54128 RepID=A0ABD2VR02_9HYME
MHERIPLTLGRCHQRTTMFRSNCPSGGLFVVEGELGLLMTAMRRGVRWSSHSHQDEDQDILMKNLAGLKETLNDAKDLSQLEPSAFMAPFLEIIRSEETTGPVTSLALSAVNKIISYGLIDPEHPAVVPCVEAIADTVTHARFVGTDASGDGVVLMRILQVLRALVLSQPGDNLSNESICEIMLSCFRICLETRLSELLRRTAEHCLRDMVYHLFVRLSQFADDTRGLLSMRKMRTNSMETTKSKPKKNKISAKPKSKLNLDDMDDAEAQLLSPVEKVEKVKVNHLATTPISPAGNIVDMQGSLNHGTSDKSDDGKGDSKTSALKNINGKEISESNTVINDPEKKISKNENLENGQEIVSLNNDNKLSEEQVDNKVGQVSNVENNQGNAENKCNDVQSPSGSIEDLSVDDGMNINNTKLPNNKPDGESVEEYVNSQGIRFTTVQHHTPYGSLCIRELFRFLVSLCSPHDKQNTEVMIHLGLSLLQVVLEVAADSLANFPSLLALAKDELARNLIVLLGTDRLSILAADVQVSFLLFESQREHLKFQLEQFIVKLMDIINSDSNRITYEQRELALEAILRLWKIPGLPAELFVNYDCGLFCINLYEELMKMLSKNVSTMASSMYSLQFIALDAIFTLIAGMEGRCKGNTEMLKTSRQTALPNLPAKDVLLNTKTKKRLLAIGAEKFNESPREGIAKLTEYGLLGGTPGHPDPNEIAKFLRENPTLDKKQIGEYISKKENGNVLQAFVNSFNWSNTRLDVAVRQYLETFRLPGEAPLIFLLLEKFAEHWHESNSHPFASTDAAFTLAYAIIMLNVDQHNNNVKRQNNPMTAEDFKKNLKSTNGDADFDQEMLDEIYTAIKTDEIVMPAEQTGLVKENYLWKCLLRRGANPESLYIRVGDASDFIDKELAEKAWAPIISALCRAYDKAPDRNFQRKVATAFFSCAAISAHYGMTSDLDTLIVSLCKFTGLAAVGQPDQIVLKLGGSGSCQLATRTLFKITHLHGDALRASWKNIVDCLQILYKAKLLPKSLTHGADFLDPSGKVSLIVESAPKPAPVEQGILSSLYSYIASDTSRTPHPAEAVAKKRANDCIAHCYLKEIIEESKLLQLDSLQSLVTALMSANPADEGTSVFLLEQLIELTIENCDRASIIYPMIQPHLESLVTASARENQPHLLERATVGMLRLGTKLLLAEDFARILLQPLAPLTHLPSASVSPLARQISYGLFELLKIGAANIHSTEDWKVVFNLLECAGAGALQPKQSSNNPQDENSSSRSTAAPLDPRPVSPVPEWVLVSPTGTGTEAPLPVAADIIVLDRKLQAHDPLALIKCCESLSFLVRDVAHVTPFNFELCVRCVRTFAEAVLNSAGKRGRVHLPAGEELPQTYQQTPIQLLDLMHTLHTKTAQVFRWWAEEGNEEQKKQISTSSLWSQAWRPLLQGIARLCCDSRRPVRAAAITSLQSTLLAHDFSQLSAVEWSQCLEQVLFPLLAQLLGPVAPSDPLGLEETRVRAAMLLSKVFLHHLNPLLTLPGFLPLWLTVLDLLRSYMHADNSENLYEAIPESLKNMLLVMASAGVLQPESYLWTPTWRAIDAFLPNLKGELFPEPPPQPAPKPPVAQSPPQSPTPTQQTPVAATPAGAAAQAQAQAQTQNHSCSIQMDASSYDVYPTIVPSPSMPIPTQVQESTMPIITPIPSSMPVINASYEAYSTSPTGLNHMPSFSMPILTQMPTSPLPSPPQIPSSSIPSPSQMTSSPPPSAQVPLQSYSIPIITPYEISPPSAQFQISSPIPIQNQISSPISSPTQSPPLIQSQNQIPTSSIPSHTQLPASSVQSQSQLTSTMPAMASSYFV